MSLTEEQYLALSALTYEDISVSKNDLDANKLSNLINPRSKPEFNALSSLSSWVLVNAYTSPSGMSAVAVSVMRCIKNLFNHKENCYA